MVGQVLLLLMLLLGLLPMARRQRCRVAAAGEGSPRRAVGCACCCQRSQSELSDRCSPGIDEQQQQFRGRLCALDWMEMEDTREKSGRVVNAAVGGTRARRRGGPSV